MFALASGTPAPDWAQPPHGGDPAAAEAGTGQLCLPRTSTAPPLQRSKKDGGNDQPTFLTKAPTMTTLTLTFNGPPSQARRALAGLLQRFRSAYFVERSSSEYEVTADDVTAAELARQPLWSTRPAQDPAQR